MLEPTSTSTVIGSGFAEALKKAAEVTQDIINPSDPPSPQAESNQQQQPTKESIPDEKVKVSDNPFSDFLGSEENIDPVTSEDSEEAPDFEKEVNDAYGDTFSDAKADKRFKELRGDLKSTKQSKYQLERSLALKEKENAELRAKTSTTNTDEYKQRYEELIKGNAILALQEDVDFQEKVAIPYHQANDTINSIIHEFKLPVQELTEAMQSTSRVERNRKLSSLLSEADMDDLSKQDFLRAIKDFEVYKGRYDEVHENAVQMYEASKQKRAEQENLHVQKRMEILKEKTPEVLGKFQSRPYFKEIFSNESSSREFEGRVKAALEKEPTPEMAVFEKASSFALMPTINWGLQMKKERDEAREALRKQSSGGASVGAGGAPNPSEGAEKLEIGQGFAKAMRQAGVKI